MSWKKILLRNQESCVLNGGTTTKYFLLGRRARQGDPYFSLFICFSLRDLISAHKIKTWDQRTYNLWPLLPLLCICWRYNLFLTRYYLYKTRGWRFLSFFVFFWTKTKLKKIWNCGIGALKGVQVAVCGLRCIDLNNDTLKILGTHFSYNKKLKEEKKIIRL